MEILPLKVGGSFAIDGEGVVSGILVPYGSPQNLDLDGEWFSPNTKDVMQVYERIKALPILLHHDLFPELLKTYGVDLSSIPFEMTGTVGKIHTMEPREEGYWVKGVVEALNAAQQDYIRFIKQLSDQGLFNWSSQPLSPKSARINRANGHIDRWVAGEGSLTTTPANPNGTRVVPVKAVSDAFKALDISVTVGDGELPEAEEAPTDEVPAKATETVNDTTDRLQQDFHDIMGDNDGWIVDRFEDETAVVASVDSRYYLVSYTETEEGYTFADRDDWQVVRRQWVPEDDAEEMPDDDNMKALALAKLELLKLDIN